MASKPPSEPDVEEEQDNEQDNVPDTEPDVEEEPETPVDPEPDLLTLQGQAIPEPQAFARLRKYISSGTTISATQKQIGRLIQAGVLSQKQLWPIRDTDEFIKRTHAKLQNPQTLLVYWRLIVFMRGNSIGTPQVEFRMAVSWAAMATMRGLWEEMRPQSDNVPARK